ncbi:MAG: T9SS type A sorting domain-containing protein [Saprospiraceae bacterium]|nr:T9SS type A sorting domain-containing protein [Saprospiraceae bacterium]
MYRIFTKTRDRIYRPVKNLIFLLFFLSPIVGWSQISTTLESGAEIIISNFPGGVCGNEVEVYLCTDCPQDLASLAEQVSIAFEAIPHANRVKVKPNVPYYPKFQATEQPFPNQFVPSSAWGTYFPIYTGIDNTPPTEKNEYMDWETNTTMPYNYNAIVKFEKGSTEGYMIIPFREEWGVNSGIFKYTTIIIPFIVEGPRRSAVEILDTITEPQIPYLILHAPPGDGSSSKFQETETICRQFKTNYADEGSNSANLAVKLGVKGSIGFINTIDYEFSVTLSAGVEVGDLSVVSNSNQTCVSISEGFGTDKLTDEEGGGDVFIGYGTDLVLGVYEFIRIDETTCEASLDTGLIYAPTGDTRTFVYTKSGIEQQIEQLQTVVADSLNKGPEVSNNAQNQIDVWNQVLSMNIANINNPDNEVINDISFYGKTMATYESNMKVVETNTIDYEHYINGNIGLEAKIEIGGSGVTGGYEYKASKRFGQTQEVGSDVTKMLNYSLTDDDSEDFFDLEIVRDPMYGTPIFKVKSTSKTSCPYQGGYQWDQPSLMFVDGSQEFTLEDIPISGTGSFQIRICNDSDEARTYHLKGNSNTNLAGAIIEGFGNNLFNTNDQGIEFEVPANDCLNAATLSIKQANVNTLNYENIELYLNVDCQPASAPITSSIFLNASFAEVTSVNELDIEPQNLTVSPNPNNGNFDVHLEGAFRQGTLVLSDLTGKRVYQTQVSQGEESVRVNQDELSPGVYILYYKSGAQLITQKLVINR